MRVVATLAFGVQSKGYEGRNRAIIVQKWEEVVSLLPTEWPKSKRMGFLGWLVGSAGLLTDRADGTLVFTHLSFQEFLTAWHLHANVEGAEPRIQGFRERMENATWWETLCLWAALIEQQSRERLGPILEALTVEAEGLSLVGAILADGLGSENSFDSWRLAFAHALRMGTLPYDSICTQSWATCRQDERKDKLRQTLVEVAREALCWVGIGYVNLCGIPALSNIWICLGVG